MFLQLLLFFLRLQWTDISLKIFIVFMLFHVILPQDFQHFGSNRIFPNTSHNHGNYHRLIAIFFQQTNILIVIFCRFEIIFSFNFFHQLQCLGRRTGSIQHERMFQNHIFPPREQIILPLPFWIHLISSCLRTSHHLIVNNLSKR